jgi:hypothetical protein
VKDDTAPFEALVAALDDPKYRDVWVPVCAQGRNRTDGLPLRRRLLYPLSYLGGGV